MSSPTDPPNVEQEKTVAWMRWRKIKRKFVNRRTLMFILGSLYWILRIVRAVKELFGGF